MDSVDGFEASTSAQDTKYCQVGDEVCWSPRERPPEIRIRNVRLTTIAWSTQIASQRCCLGSLVLLPSMLPQSMARPLPTMHNVSACTASVVMLILVACIHGRFHALLIVLIFLRLGRSCRSHQCILWSGLSLHLQSDPRHYRPISALRVSVPLFLVRHSSSHVKSFIKMLSCVRSKVRVHKCPCIWLNAYPFGSFVASMNSFDHRVASGVNAHSSGF